MTELEKAEKQYREMAPHIQRRETAQNLKALIDRCKGLEFLVDSAHEIVSSYHPEFPEAGLWKKDWLEKADELIPQGDSNE